MFKFKMPKIKWGQIGSQVVKGFTQFATSPLGATVLGAVGLGGVTAVLAKTGKLGAVASAVKGAKFSLPIRTTSTTRRRRSRKKKKKKTYRRRSSGLFTSRTIKQLMEYKMMLKLLEGL